MSHYPTVAVVILNWNGRKLLEKYLPSVINHSMVPGVSIYVADNASTDDSLEFLEAEYGLHVHILKNEGNYGFAKGYNEALKGLTEKYFILLNSDVEVAANWIPPVISLMESNDNIAACQPKILSYTEKHKFEYAGACGGFLDHYGYPFCRGRIFDQFEQDDGQYDDEADIFWASGAALFIRADLFFRSGGFEEHFFAHMEEIDLCWRLRRMGYSIKVCPSSEVFHLGGGTLHQMSPRKTYLNFRNNRLMMVKNLDRKHLASHFIIRNFMDILAALHALILGRFREFAAIMKALVDFHIVLPGWVRKRRQIERTLHLSNDHVHFYPYSIVYQFFVNKITAFKDLPQK